MHYFVCWDAKIRQSYFPGSQHGCRKLANLPENYRKITRKITKHTEILPETRPTNTPNAARICQNYFKITPTLLKTYRKPAPQITEKYRTITKKLPPRVILRAMPLGCVSAPYNSACHDSGAVMGHPAGPSRGVFCILYNEFTHE
jgi:hypothetical protein